MKAREIALAVEADERRNGTLNVALLQVLPILRRIAKRQRFWLKWGMNALIKAIEEYLKSMGFQPE